MARDGDAHTGVVFFGTRNRAEVVSFYTDVVGADVWLEQPDCTILDFEGFRFGFCERTEVDDCAIVTFAYDSREAVDRMYDRVGDAARGEPSYNETYEVYQFFADDPDGRAAEFQRFEHDD